MPISDLTGYTWVGNDSLDYYINTRFNITFNSNGSSFGWIAFNPPDPNFILIYSGTTVYHGSWVSNGYKTIQITGGTDANNPTLISWLDANGTLTAPQSQLSVDLTTLSGWSDVSAGSHTLKVKAKATGYRDSALSAGASFTKAEQYVYEQTGTVLKITSAPYEQSGGTLIL